MRVAVLPFLLSRGWVALFVYLGHARHPFLAPVPGGWEGVANWWLNPWTTYDSEWFLRIAATGYEPISASFFPLYSLLLKFAGPDPARMAAWGIFLSNLAFAGALVLLYQLTALDYDRRVGRISVWLLAFFPTAAVFSAVYSESVFLLFIVAAFLSLRRERWGWTGFWAFLAALTRNSGPLIFLALGLEWARRRKAAPSAARLRDLIAVSLPLVGFALVQLYLRTQFHDLLPGLGGIHTLTRKLTWPWQPVLDDVMAVVATRRLDLVTLLSVSAVLSVFVFVLVRWRRLPPSYTLLLLGITLLQLTYAPVTAPHTNSILRYLSTTFPFVQLLALYPPLLFHKRLRRVTGYFVYLAICATFSYLFGMKWYVAG